MISGPSRAEILNFTFTEIFTFILQSWYSWVPFSVESISDIILFVSEAKLHLFIF